MKEIGEQLREAREKKNISLKEIQEATKIRLRYLEAIESGNLEIIPGEVYRKGFIANYAAAVGLDSEELIRKYHNLKTDEAPPVVKPVPVPERKNEPENRSAAERIMIGEPLQHAPKPKSKQPVRLNLTPVIVMAGIILGVISVYQVFNSGLFKTKTAAAGPKPVAKTVKPVTKVNAGQVVKPIAPQPNKKSAQTTVQQIFPAPITVYAEFSAQVWVQVKADGQIKYQDGATFNAKSPKQLWTANSELVIRIGNPAGLKLTLNGKTLGPLGESGKPRTVTLTVNGLVES